MKKNIFLILVTFLPAFLWAQTPIKISALPTASFSVFDSIQVPVNEGSTTKKGYGWQLKDKIAGNKVDSITRSNDTIFQWKAGVKSISNKLPVKVDSIYRVPGNDSIFFKINGIVYKIKDSTGSSAAGLNATTAIDSNTTHNIQVNKDAGLNGIFGVSHFGTGYFENNPAYGGLVGISNQYGGTVQIKAQEIPAGYITLQAPNEGGTIALTNYRSYSILLTNSSGTFTVKQLRNKLGNGSNDGVNDIAWTNPSNGVLRATMTGAPFLANKTFVVTSSLNIGGQPYFTTPEVASTSIVNIELFLYDGTQTGTPNFTDMPIEIRVYN